MGSKRKMMEAFESECSRFGYDFTKQEGWEDEYEEGDTAHAWDQWQEAVAYAAREAAQVCLGIPDGGWPPNGVRDECAEAILAHFGIDPKEKV